ALFGRRMSPYGRGIVGFISGAVVLYSSSDLAAVPAEANLGLSCGNPTAFAALRPGEVVVDLGCGGGLDLLLAAQKVGAEGRLIGIDMTPEMVELARRNIQRAGVANVQVYQATIDRLPLADASVDCIISNCVINLAPDKAAVFREMARVLRPGGRVAVSDIALKQPLPAELAADLAAYVGCLAGAISIDAYHTGLEAAGLTGVTVVDSGADLNAYAMGGDQAGCCGPAADVVPLGGTSGCATSRPTSTLHQRLAALLQRYNVNDYAASVRVYAIKPGG
ncbi:MAG: arsenite methyltransferase, partial [Pirellulales bacterium]|nr:arsenite methyltransferase [Pirellulales bacterium]